MTHTFKDEEEEDVQNDILGNDPIFDENED